MLELLGRLGLAAALGGLIGLEREAHHRPAGFRTHMIVCLGSCLFMRLSLFMTVLDPSADPGRIASQVVTGIGFLGAGTILKTGMTVHGLTTAAILWTAAAIGLAVGAGYWAAAFATTALTLLAIFAFRPFERALFANHGACRLLIRAKNVPGIMGRIEEALVQASGVIRRFDFQRQGTDEPVEISVTVSFPAGEDQPSMALKRLRDLSDIDGVASH